jgi:hypothetical protein
VATIAFDGFDAKPASRQPISAHPAFPAIVALWFAALLGLGSMVLPAVLLERVLVGTGVASLVPAAGPPLGFTARTLIAVVAALLGAVIGIAVARRVARAQADEPPLRFSQVESRRPISVHDELGGEGLVNGRGVPITRRRALAITEDDRPSDFLYMAPLPGEDSPDPELTPVAGLTPYVAEDDTLELCDAVDEAPEAAVAEPAETPFEEEEMTDVREFQPLPEPEAVDAEEVAQEEFDAPEPLPFAAPSLSRRIDHHLDFAPPTEAAAPELDPEPEAAWGPEPAPEQITVHEDWATAEPENLGLVQLVQRLGSSIERRRAWLAENVGPPATVLHSVPDELEAAPPEEAAQAMADYFGRSEPQPKPPAPEPQVFAPVAGEPARAGYSPPQLRMMASLEQDEEADESVPNFSLPLRKPASLPPLTQDEAAEEEFASAPEEATDAEDAGYSSLLAMGNPFAARESEFVRIDEPEAEADAPEPAVVFPTGQPPAPFGTSNIGNPFASPTTPRQFDAPGKAAPAAAPKPAADTEAALRAALATLQRMSGVA